MNSYKCAVLVCPVFQVTARYLGFRYMSVSGTTEAGLRARLLQMYCCMSVKIRLPHGHDQNSGH